MANTGPCQLGLRVAKTLLNTQSVFTSLYIQNLFTYLFLRKICDLTLKDLGFEEKWGFEI